LNDLVTRAWQRGEAVLVQGVYRVSNGGRVFLESFVAAPGPMGWRYFGRVHPPDSDDELFTVDYVVDAEWGLIRYRLMHQSGTSIVATPATGGIEVVTGRPGDERTETVPGASAVWSSSPCSLLVLSASGGSDVGDIAIQNDAVPADPTDRKRDAWVLCDDRLCLVHGADKCVSEAERYP
jgi:hypothetical protein